MKRTGLLAALALTSAPGLAQGSIPPSYRVLVVSADDSEAAARSAALVEYMSTLGAFARVEPAIARHEVRNCLQKGDFAGCVRALTPAPEHWQDPPHVVIRAQTAGSGHLAWTCVGSGTHRPPTAAQRVDVDAQAALFGEEPAQTGALRAAMQCIQSAALESSQP